jgi:hypothetical protein
LDRGLFLCLIRKNASSFNKKGVKTWWFRKKVVILHPLFVAPVPGA